MRFTRWRDKRRKNRWQKRKIAALLIAAAVAAGGWALPARVSAAENDGTAVTWQQDETESSEQNSDEEAAVQEQMKSERLKADLITNVSHDIKTPLTSISGYAEIMKSGLVKPDDMIGFSERIYNEASRLITLIEDIIKLSKLDEGMLKLSRRMWIYYFWRTRIIRLAIQ